MSWDWQPKTMFNALVEIMVKEDQERWQRWLKGERFPWDVPDKPEEKRVLERL
jgi:GDPmannose 4,6-dehydratase